MGLFFIYSLKVAFCLAAFYLLYKLLLSRETFFGFNRAVVLGLTGLSLVLPLVQIDGGSDMPAAGGFVVIEDFIIESVASGYAAPAFSVLQACIVIYIIGVAFFLVREVWSLVSLCRMVHSGRVVSRDGGVRVVVVKGDVSPFSWFGNIIISESDYAHSPEFILTHERAHVAGRHSVDILLCDVLIMFQWFNPAAWLIKAELQNLHEYEADRVVLASGADAAEYQLLLIRKAVGDKLFTMANNLNQCSIKKRIAMMLTKKSNPWSGARILLALPVAAVAVVAFATPKAESLSNEINAESRSLMNTVVSTVSPSSVAPQETALQTAVTPDGVADTGSNVAADNSEIAVVGYNGDGKKGKVYDVVEVKPEFPGGMGAMMEYFAANIKYPETAAKANIQGRVIVRFVVDTEGNVTEPEIVRGVDPALDAEAIRVVSSMPRWTPGKQDGKAVRVRFVMPVNFSTAAGKTDINATAGLDKPESGKAQKPIYFILDGKHVDSMPDIKSDDIERIEVYKDKANTVDKYGEAAAGGVMVITSKKK